jgi:hypothetical protein
VGYSVVQFLAESFDLFGAGPERFVIRFHCSVKILQCELISPAEEIGTATWAPEYEKDSLSGFTCRCAGAFTTDPIDLIR